MCTGYTGFANTFRKCSLEIRSAVLQIGAFESAGYLRVAVLVNRALQPLYRRCNDLRCPHCGIPLRQPIKGDLCWDPSVVFHNGLFVTECLR